MNERPQKVITTVTHEGPMKISGAPFDLWLRGELDDAVDAPEGSRVEVIGGRVVVSPAPSIPHGNILRHVTRAFEIAAYTDPDFPWAAQQVANISLFGLEDGYIPDLIIAMEETLEAAGDDGLVRLAADELEMAVEVTSKDGAKNDRPPRKDDDDLDTKWKGYARAEVPYYLLIDRDPKVACTTLYSIPDRGAAAYLHEERWQFGAVVHLPDPFNIDLDTTRWKPWKK